MDIQTRKIEFIREFMTLQNEELLTLLEKSLHSEKRDSHQKVSALTLQELNQQIDQSMDDSMNGRLTDSEVLTSEIKKWK